MLSVLVRTPSRLRPSMRLASGMSMVAINPEPGRYQMYPGTVVEYGRQSMVAINPEPGRYQMYHCGVWYPGRNQPEPAINRGQSLVAISLRCPILESRVADHSDTEADRHNKNAVARPRTLTPDPMPRP
eukprot:2268401-Rhodomonas_salina.1